MGTYFFNLGGGTIANCDLLLGNGNQAKAFYDETFTNDSSAEDTMSKENRAGILTNAVLAYLNTDKNKSIECFNEADFIYDSLEQENPDYVNWHILLLLLSASLFPDDLPQVRHHLQKA